jgi:ribose transport system substrate-binding protein
MATSDSGRATYRAHVVLLIVVGVIAIAGAAAWAGWITGTFHKLPDHPRMAIVAWNQDTYWDPVEAGAADAAKSVGADLTFIRSEPTVDAESKHIRDLIDSGVQAVAIAPNNPSAEQQVIDEAADKAVVVTFDSDAPSTKRKGYVGTDDYAAGETAGDEVRAAVPEGGQVIISVGSVEMSNGRDRRQGLIDNLLDHPARGFHRLDAPDQEAKGKQYEVVATVTDGGDHQAAVRNVADAIRAHPDVKCIVGLFGYSGPAIVQAIQQAKPKNNVKVIGFDESAEEQALVQSGAIYSSILQAQYRCGHSLVQVMSDLLRGEEANGPAGPRLVELPVLVMRPDNLEQLREARVIRKVATATPTTAPAVN